LEQRNHWEDLDVMKVYNVQMDLGEIEWEHVDWIHLALDRGQWWALVSTVKNFRVP
jgi:hypothetical protein